MRISQAMRDYFKNACQDAGDKAFLFGSRVDNCKQGGDVDIIILSKKNMTIAWLGVLGLGLWSDLAGKN